MAKAEEELQRVDFKVHVNCCDGCKRKVKKALDIKGVLKIEIHPSLPKLTVIGDFDVRIVLKRLAKVGKTAEIIPPEETKKSKQSDGSDEKGKPKEEKPKEEKQKKEKALKDKSKPEDYEKNKETKNEAKEKDSNKPKNKEEIIIKEPMDQQKHESDIEPNNYMMHPNMVTPNPPPMYYQMMPMPMPCYSMNNTYPRPIIPYLYAENGYYEAPLNRRVPPPPVHSQATVFADYFHEDNAASCHVM